MKRISKVLAWSVGCVLLLAVGSLIALLTFVDPNDYKAEIAELVRHHTGRELRIQGQLKLTFFPWVGIETGSLSLSNPPGFKGEEMLGIASARARLQLLPLLRKQLRIDTVELRRPRAHLIVLQNGRSNWDDLVGDHDEQAPAQAVVALTINGLVVEEGEVVWQDQRNGSRYDVTDVNFQTGPVVNKRPVEIRLHCQLKGVDLPQTKIAVRTHAVLDIKDRAVKFIDPQFTATLAGNSSAAQAENVEYSQARQLLRAEKLSLQLAISGDSFDVQITTLEFDMGDGKLQVDQMHANGGSRGVNLSAQIPHVSGNLEKQTLVVPSFTLRSKEARVAGLLSAHRVLDGPVVEGRIQTNSFGLQRYLRIFYPGWQPSDRSALANAQLVSEFSVDRNGLLLKQIQARIDDTQVSGFFSLRDLIRPKYQFDLRVSAVNLDRYLPAQSDADTDIPGVIKLALPVEIFKDLDANGVVSMDSMQVAGLRADNLLLAIRSNNQTVDVGPVRADFYGGKFTGSMQFNPPGHLKIDQQLTGVRLGPLLSATKVTDRIDGVGSLNITASAVDGSQGRSVDGRARFRVGNGVVKGVDMQKIAEHALQIYDQAKGREKRSFSDDREQFEFTEMQGSIRFDERTAVNQDLRIKSPLLRVLGKGSADLVQQKLDYAIELHVVQSERGQGGEELAQLRGVPIPVHVEGPIGKPEYRIDVERLVQLALQARLQKEQAKLQQKLENKLQKKLDKLLQ